MTAYEICYLEDDGSLICAFSVQFDDAMRAKILAHAMKPASCHRLEVWSGRELVYCRPERGIEIPVPAARMPQRRAHATAA